MTELAEDNYQRRFGGIRRLYGAAAFERFQNAHVCVIGIGGVGSWAVEALARSAIGKITMIDLDNIAESNVNRQIHALDGNFGKAKILAMRERIHAINPRCQVTLIEDYIEPGNLSSLIPKAFDYVIDCIDNYRTKAALVHYCKRNKIKLITVGGAGGQIDPTCIKLADLSRTEQDALLAKVRKLLRQEYRFSHNPARRFDIPAVYSNEQLRFPTEDGDICYEKKFTETRASLHCGGLGSVTCVTATFGFVAVAHVLKKLAGISRKG